MTESGPHGPAFFEHLSFISAEYERLQSENRSLRCALLEASSGDVLAQPLEPFLQEEARHGAVDEDVDNVRAFEDDDLKPHAPQHRKNSLRLPYSEDPYTVSAENSMELESKLGQANRRTRAVFGNGDDIKDLIKGELAEPRYDVKNMYKTEGWAQFVARHQWFENVTMCVIVVYAIYMSVDADWNSATLITNTEPGFIVCEQVFCLYFFMELVIRFLAFQRKMNCFKDAWFVFDFVLVLMMVAETWIMNIVILALASMNGGNSDANFLGDAAILRMARLMRLTRLLRMARLIRMVPELLIMVKAVASAARSVGFTLLLLGISLYVFAIAFRMTLEGTGIGAEKYQNCAIAMHRLLMHGTFLDDVSGEMDALLEQSLPGFILMYIFIVLSAVTIMNMLIGILCEVITAVADAEKEALQVSWTTEVLQTCLSAGADQNNDGCIDLQEFHSMIQNQQVRKVLKEVDVDVQTLVNFSDVLFEDEDGTTQPQLPFADFMQRLLQLRGRNTATVKDLVDLRKWISRELRHQSVSSPKHVPGSDRFTPVTPCHLSSSRQGTSSSTRPTDGWAFVPGQVP